MSEEFGNIGIGGGGGGSGGSSGGSSGRPSGTTYTPQTDWLGLPSSLGGSGGQSLVTVRGDNVYYEGRYLGNVSEPGRPADRTRAIEQIASTRGCEAGGTCGTLRPIQAPVVDITRYTMATVPSTPQIGTSYVPALEVGGTPKIETPPLSYRSVLSDPIDLLESKRELAGKYYGQYEKTTKGVDQFLSEHPEYTIPEAQAAVLGWASERATPEDIGYARAELDRTIRELGLPDTLSEAQKDKAARIAAETQKYGLTRAGQERYPGAFGTDRQWGMWGSTVYSEPFVQMFAREGGPLERFGAEFGKMEGQRSILANLIAEQGNMPEDRAYDYLRSGLTPEDKLSLMRGAIPEVRQHYGKWGSDYQYSLGLLGNLYGQIRPESRASISGGVQTDKPKPSSWSTWTPPWTTPEEQAAEEPQTQFRSGAMRTRMENRLSSILSSQSGWTPEMAENIFGSLNEKLLQPVVSSAVPVYGLARSVSKAIPKATVIK